jgi:RHS repeat-associated protein
VSGAAPGLRLKNYYQFNSKESQNDLGLGWSDYGARFYSVDIARWNTIDPLADKMRRWSPYVFSFDNPLRFQDPDGRSPWPAFIVSVVSWYYALEAKFSPHQERQNTAINSLIQDNMTSNSNQTGSKQFIGADREFSQPVVNLVNGGIVAEEAGHKAVDITVGVGRPVADGLEMVGAGAEVAGAAGALFTEGGSLPLVPTGEALGKVGGAMNKSLDLLEGNNSHLAEDLLYDKGKGIYFGTLDKALDGAQSAGALTKPERTAAGLLTKGLEKTLDAANDLRKSEADAKK